jgi:hypothetical protein
MVSRSGRFHPNEAEVAAKVMDGEAIIINLSNGMYYSMDQVGGLIWEMITEGHTLDDIASAVVRSYDVSDGQAQADIQRLAVELVDENLVIPSTVAAPTRDDRKQARQDKLPYEQPRLNKYSDMADLLALDPPMPGLEDIPWKEPSEQTSR